MKLSSLTSVATVLAVSLGTSVAQAENNPFMAKPLSSITLADNHANHEGKCGEGKCGGAKKDKHLPADSNKDGMISKAEFTSHHEQMFSQADANKDGMLDAKEHKALHRAMKAHKEGKCGEGKCGGAK
jgi:uncharacterized low-complexity protein